MRKLKVLDGGEQGHLKERMAAILQRKTDVAVRRSPEAVLRVIELLRSSGEPNDDLTAYMTITAAHLLLFEKLSKDMQDLCGQWLDVFNGMRKSVKDRFGLDLAEYAGEVLRKYKTEVVHVRPYYALPAEAPMYELGAFFFVEFRCGHYCVRAVRSGRAEEAEADGCPYCLEDR